ncbi:MAG: BrnT family toxin [Rhodospirillales bacterium]|nr:BrnT family toxin [Rhodospirillales bacterium]
MLSWDESKRAQTLAKRGLDFADAEELFAGRHFTSPDERRNYGEPRFVSAGRIKGRFIVLVWTPRGMSRRIISMRYGHEWEEARYREYLDGPR